VRRTYSALELAELLEIGLETVYRHIREIQDDEADGAMRVPREVVRKWLIERNALNL
jgi:predicted DNA-binding transcriptional regulator YafY